MPPRDLFSVSKAGAVAVGTGLISLDIVIDTSSQSIWRWAGGTCGNVLTILSYLDWDSYPVARLNGDKASRYVQADLKRWGVHQDFLHTPPESSTPIIIERLRRTKEGQPIHSFSWNCPGCGAWLPGFRAVHSSGIQGILEQLKNPAVLFLDRVSRGAIDLAKGCAEKGAVIFFEPSGIGDPKLFEEAISIAHVVKYSHERFAHVNEISSRAKPLLEIETLGGEGLRFRANLQCVRGKPWTKVSAFRTIRLKDTAGAGDWCSAGILHRIGQKGLASLKKISGDELKEALEFGQALAAWNCGFEGPRGGMYRIDKAAFKEQVSRILAQEMMPDDSLEQLEASKKNVIKEFCTTCARSGS